MQPGLHRRSLKDAAVAEVFNVFFRLTAHQIQSRIEPVNGRNGKQKQLEPQISPLIVCQLMAQNKRKLFTVAGCFGQIKSRMEKSGKYRRGKIAVFHKPRRG